jgi:hypothetical protein
MLTWLRLHANVIVIIGLTLIAVVTRVQIALSGGAWADEAFALLVAKGPSLGSMTAFLHFHESHPPLFYILLRASMQLTGDSETAVRLICALTGVAIVPATYALARTLFSERAALLAMLFVTFSPALAEHSVQIRPYGLMALLSLLSCCSMIGAIEHRYKSAWFIYVMSTILLVYTHNWAWLIVIGQHVAVIMILSRRDAAERKWIAISWLQSWLVIAAAFLPWTPALVYQIGHAGHGGIPVEGMSGAVELAAYGLYTISSTLIFGESASPWLLIPAAAAGVAFVIAKRFRIRNSRVTDSTLTSNTPFVAVTVVVGVTVIAAIALSPFSNQLLPRCIATLVPLAALMGGHLVDSSLRRSSATRFVPVIAAAAACFVLVAGGVSLFAIVDTPRSNAREVANAVRARMRASDLVVISPEWFAASFNLYFPPSIEQIDFPYRARSGLIDFADVWYRASDPRHLAELQRRLAEAAKAGQRVWFVSDERYLRGVSDEMIRKADARRDPVPYSILRVGQIRESLQRWYGMPDSVQTPGARRPRYDRLHAYLYSRRPPAAVSGR